VVEFVVVMAAQSAANQDIKRALARLESTITGQEWGAACDVLAVLATTPLPKALNQVWGCD
jgi:hypothetical protein